MTPDLENAKAMLRSRKFTCVLCRGNQIRTCMDRGVLPLVRLLEEGSFHGFSAADKVVGKATAFLYVLLGVDAVYTPVASEGAIQILKQHGIPLFYDSAVPAIFNRSRTGYCPMETAVRDISDPRQAYAAIVDTPAKMR